MASPLTGTGTAFRVACYRHILLRLPTLVDPLTQYFNLLKIMEVHSQMLNLFAYEFLEILSLMSL